MKFVRAGIGMSHGEHQGHATEAVIWLLTNASRANLAVLREWFAADPDSDRWVSLWRQESKAKTVDVAAQQMQADAIPLFEACFESEQPLVQFHALRHWAAFNNESHIQRIVERLRIALAAKDSGIVPRIVRWAWEWNAGAVEADVWNLLGHKSRAVREITATLLAKLGDSRLGKARELWSAKRADARIAAVSWLKALGTPKALTELKARLETEADDNVRDALMTGTADE